MGSNFNPDYSTPPPSYSESEMQEVTEFANNLIEDGVIVDKETHLSCVKVALDQIADLQTLLKIELKEAVAEVRKKSGDRKRAPIIKLLAPAESKKAYRIASNILQLNEFQTSLEEREQSLSQEVKLEQEED